jgi:ribonuclease VapC
LTIFSIASVLKSSRSPPEQARIARDAYRDYGRGSGHAANLNFGDCFSYALARAMREPILFKGEDFIHTDLRSAVPTP